MRSSLPFSNTWAHRCRGNCARFNTHRSASAGPYVTAPHSQRRVRRRPHGPAMLPTSIRRAP
jgi:hypothetical protein